MATIEQLAIGAKLYLDANIIIYYVEGTGELQTAAEHSLEIAGARQCTLVTSEISIAECLYGAFKRGDEDLVGIYKQFFRDRDLMVLVPITIGLLENSAETGALLGLKTIDAIHVASAILFGCDAILSNDRALRAPDTLSVITLAII